MLLLILIFPFPPELLIIFCVTLTIPPVVPPVVFIVDELNGVFFMLVFIVNSLPLSLLSPFMTDFRFFFDALPFFSSSFMSIRGLCDDLLLKLDDTGTGAPCSNDGSRSFIVLCIYIYIYIHIYIYILPFRIP